MRQILLSITAVAALNASQNLIEIYSNAQFLHQSFNDVKSEFSTELPASLRLDDVEISATCDVKHMKFDSPKKAPNTQEEQIRSQISSLESEIFALEQKQNFLLKATPNMGDFDNLRQQGEKFYELALADNTKKKELEKQISQLKKSILENSVSAQTQRLHASFACEPKNIKISYPIYAEISLDKQIHAHTNDKKLEISQNLKIKNPLPTALKDLSIAIYPFEFSKNLAPVEFAPDYLGDERQARLSEEAYIATPMMMAATKEVSMETVSGKNEELSFANAYRLDGLSLGALEQKSFEYDKQINDAEFGIFIDGYANADAYVMAKFKPSKNISASKTDYKIDGVSIGDDFLQGFDAGKDVTIYLGKNALISVSKKTDEKMSSESFFGNTKTTISSWNYEIKNGSKHTWNVILAESIPLSAHTDIKVIDKSKDKSQTSKDGKVEYKFELKSGNSKSINFGYEISQPK